MIKWLKKIYNVIRHPVTTKVILALDELVGFDLEEIWSLVRDALKSLEDGNFTLEEAANVLKKVEEYLRKLIPTA